MLCVVLVNAAIVVVIIIIVVVVAAIAAEAAHSPRAVWRSLKRSQRSGQHRLIPKSELRALLGVAEFAIICPEKTCFGKEKSKPPKMCSRKKDQQKHPNMQILEFERVVVNFREKNSDTWEILVNFP